MKHLTFKQLKFIDMFVDTQDLEASAKFAGVTPENAQKWLKNKDFNRLLESYDNDRTYITKDYILKNIEEVIARSLKGHPKYYYDKEQKCMMPLEDEKGNPVYEYDPSSVLKALDMLGKHKKMFTDRHESLSLSTSTSFEEYIKQIEGDEW